MKKAAIDAIIEKICREATEELTRQSAELLQKGVASLLPQLREAVEIELRDRLGATLLELPSDAAESSRGLLEATQAISAANGQSDVLSALLDGAERFSSRSGLLIVRGALAVGWQARGLERSVMMRLQFDCATPLIERTIQENHATAGSSYELPESYRMHCGAAADDRVYLFPLTIHGRVAALLLADGGEEDNGVDAAAIELIVRHAALTLEAASAHAAAQHAAQQQTAQQATVAEASHATPEPTPEPAETAPSHVEAAQAEPYAEAPAAPAANTYAEPPASAYVEPAPSAPPYEAPAPYVETPSYAAPTSFAEPNHFAPAPAAAPEAPVSGFRFTPATESSFAPAPVETTPEPTPSIAAQDPYVAPAPPMIPPVAPPVQDYATPAPVAAVSDEMRSKARRFAKLLVDEIKLYKGPMVVRGAQESDLYKYLQDEIDKSRAAYQKRFGAQISDVDYFREECVRLLANGDSSRLGAGFPA